MSQGGFHAGDVSHLLQCLGVFYFHLVPFLSGRPLSFFHPFGLPCVSFLSGLSRGLRAVLVVILCLGVLKLASISIFALSVHEEAAKVGLLVALHKYILAGIDIIVSIAWSSELRPRSRTWTSTTGTTFRTGKDFPLALRSGSIV